MYPVHDNYNNKKYTNAASFSCDIFRISASALDDWAGVQDMHEIDDCERVYANYRRASQSRSPLP